jgi:hypothetical protein
MADNRRFDVNCVHRVVLSRLIGNGLGLGYDALNRARIVSRLIEPAEHQLSLMVTYDDAELPRPTRCNSCLFDRTNASSHELLHVRGEQIIRNLAAHGIRHRSRNRAEVPLPSALEDQFALVSSDPIPELNANPVLAVDRKANWTPEKAESDFAPKLAYVVIERGLEAT